MLKGHEADQRKYGAYWNELIKAAADAGQLRPGTDLFVSRMLVLGALNWTAEWYEPKRGKSAAAIADQAVAMVLHGWRRPADADPRPSGAEAAVGRPTAAFTRGTTSAAKRSIDGVSTAGGRPGAEPHVTTSVNP